MYWIRRIRFVRVGHDLAWFSDLTVSAFDLKSDLPCDTVLFAENGDGKTTLLALTFSCIETDQRRFLKTLIKKNYKFHEYFRQEPGFILIEWEHVGAPTLFAPQTRKLITGQAVALRGDKPATVDRLFFLFDSGPSLNLDNLPMEPGALPSFDRVRRWALEMENLHRSDLRFYKTDNQEAWQKRLTECGIDVPLIANQVDFCIFEGGIDKAFLDFDTEDEFLRKLFRLTLNERTMEAFRQELETYTEKLRSRPDQEKRLKALRNVQPHLDTFVGLAGKIQGAKRILTERLAEAAGARLAVQARLDAFELKVSDANSRRKQHLLEAEGKAKAERVCEANIESYEAELLHRALEAAKRNVSAAEKSIKTADLRLNSIEAARLDRQHQSLSVQVKVLKDDLATATSDLEPLRQELRVVGAHLRSALEAEADKNRAQQEKYRLASGDAKRRREAAETERERTQATDRQLADEWGPLRAKIDLCQAQREELLKEEVLHPEETGAAAQFRWETRIATLQTVLDQIDEGSRLHLAELEDLRTQQRSHEIKQAQAEKDIGHSGSYLDEADRQRKELSRLPVLRQLFEAESADPDDEQTYRQLGIELKNSQRLLHSIQHRLNVLERSKQRIVESGIAFADDDVEQVVEHLNSAGIRGAMPFPRYIAAVEQSSPEYARSLVLSDPARFLGVGVPSACDVESARALSLSLKLSRPIVISVLTDKQGAVHADRAVLPPEHDAAYHNGAAQTLLASFEVQRQGAQTELEQAKHQAEAVDSARQSLSSYRSNFSVASQREAAEKLKEAQERSATAQAYLVENGERQTFLKQKLQELDEAAAEPREALAAATGKHQRCIDFVRQHETHLSDIQTRERDVLVRRQKLQHSLKRQQELAEKAGTEEANEASRAKSAGDRAQKLLGEFDAVEYAPGREHMVVRRAAG